MRISIIACVALLLPAAGFADTIVYTFTGHIDNDIPGFTNVWNGPGPEPTTFQMTFDVNTQDPANATAAVYTFGPSPVGPAINAIAVDLVTANFALTVDGSPVLRSATGSFGFSGTPLGGPSLDGGSYIGGGFGAGNDTNSVSFFGEPDFGLAVVTQAQLTAASDPLSTLLNGSTFSTDLFAEFNYEGSTLYGNVSGFGQLVAPVGVPTPGTFALVPLGALFLGFAHRRRRRA